MIVFVLVQEAFAFVTDVRPLRSVAPSPPTATSQLHLKALSTLLSAVLQREMEYVLYLVNDV